MRLLICITVVLAQAITPTIAAQPPKPIWLAVAAPSLAEALAPLADERRKEGFEAIVSTKPIEKAMAELGRQPDFLLLVGDYEPGKQDEPWYLPVKQKNLYRWSYLQPPTFASDSAWGDLDGDDLPDIPVGRIPARTPEQVKLVVSKILAYQRRPVAVGDLRMPIWCGSPEFGKVFELLFANLSINTIKMHGPQWAEVSLIIADPRHALAGWPPDQPNEFLKRVARRAAFTCLMGHGRTNSFYSMRHNGKWVGLTSHQARIAMADGEPTAPMVLFTCSSGDFTGPEHCFTETVLFAPGGPVAAIGATTESHPLPNYFAGVSLLQQLSQPHERLGTAWLISQRRAGRLRNFMMERLLMQSEGSLDAEIDVAKLRRDGPLMYALLGDPATRLRLPKPLKLTVEQRDGQWHWKAQKPDGATELHVALRAPMLSFPVVKAPVTAESASLNSRAANDMFVFKPLPSPQGAWSGTLNQPGLLRLIAVAPGQLYVATATLAPPAVSQAPRQEPASETQLPVER